jgi:hypothetical protein
MENLFNDNVENPGEIYTISDEKNIEFAVYIETIDLERGKVHWKTIGGQDPRHNSQKVNVIGTFADSKDYMLLGPEGVRDLRTRMIIDLGKRVDELAKLQIYGDVLDGTKELVSETQKKVAEMQR